MFCQQSRFKEVHKLLPKDAQKIIHQLHVKPKLAKPWFGEFVMAMHSEVFSCLSEGIIQRTNFGHEFIESNTRLIIKIKDIRKANYLFAQCLHKLPQWKNFQLRFPDPEPHRFQW